MFQKISGIEKFYASEGYVTIFSRNFFVSQCRKYSQVNPSVLCFRKFPVAKKFMDKRGEYQDFPSKICLTMPKISVGESFTVALISGSEKVYGQEGGGEYQDFPSKIFCLTVPKNFVVEPFSVSLISGIEKFYASEGYFTIFDFLSNFFVSQCRKSR